MSHLSQRALPASRPPHLPVGAPRVQPELPLHPEAFALRIALRFRAGGDKLDVLALRFGMNRADVSRTLNSAPTPLRILRALTIEERAHYYLALSGAERRAA